MDIHTEFELNKSASIGSWWGEQCRPREVRKNQDGSLSTRIGVREGLARLMLVALILLLTTALGACRNRSQPETESSQDSAVSADGERESSVDAGDDATGEGTTTSSTTSSTTQGGAASRAASSAPDPTSGRLVRAAQLYGNGDYVAVRRELADLLKDDGLAGSDGLTRAGEQVALRVKAEAQFMLAKSYLANDEYGATLLAIDPVLDGLGDEALRAKMLYLRAEALSGLGRYKEAIAGYKEFEAVYPEATAVVQEQIAASFFALGNLTDAALAYELAANAESDAAARARLLEALAQIYVATGQTDKAIDVYDRILRMARKPVYRAGILFAAGQVLANVDDEDGAIARWRAAMDEAPENNVAYLSLIELVERDAPVDQFVRGYIDLEAEAYFPAIDAFETFLDEVDPTDKRAGEATHYLGQSYLGAGNYEVAGQLFERVIEIYPSCTCVGQAWLDLAESQAWLGNGAQARRTYRTFAREESGDELAAEALWRSGRLAFNEGSQLEVAADFFALADDFPDSERAPTALYIVGIGAYRAGLTGQAVRVYERMQDRHESYRADAVGYWLGRAYFDADEADKARAEWRAVADTIPDTFYGVMSALALRKPGRATNILPDVGGIAGEASTLSGDDGSQAFAEGWLDEWLESMSGSTLPAEVDRDVDLQVGRVMLELDQRFEALTALERVYDRYKATPELLYPLSLEFERLGAYRLSLITMERLIQLSPAELVEDTPIFLQRYVYPRRYPDLVVAAAQKNDIDPLLYYSLIRQESLFEKGARSYAAAQGLAQIIPDTAQWIADQVAYPNFENDLVLRPHINVDFGAYYLDWARDYLDDNLISALVGYNAGPGNSLEWRKISGLDDALFVEILSVNEPRLYILKITSNYYHYNRLYSE